MLEEKDARKEYSLIDCKVQLSKRILLAFLCVVALMNINFYTI